MDPPDRPSSFSNRSVTPSNSNFREAPHPSTTAAAATVHDDHHINIESGSLESESSQSQGQPAANETPHAHLASPLVEEPHHHEQPPAPAPPSPAPAPAPAPTPAAHLLPLNNPLRRTETLMFPDAGEARGYRLLRPRNADTDWRWD